MEIEHVSVSRIQTYNQCPVRYGLRYDLDKDKRPVDLKNVWLLKGSAMHHAIEETLIDFKGTGVWNTKLLQDSWVKEATKLGVSIKIIEEGKKALLLWSKRYERPTKIIDIEKKWEYEIDGVPVVFIPDLVEETYIDGEKTLLITDWKSNAMAYSTEKMQEDLQAPFYLHELKRQYPDYDKYVFRFDFVFVNKVVEYDMPEERWKDVTNFLLESYNTIANDKNPIATPNEYCQYCPGVRTLLCPIAKQMVESGDISKEDIDSMAKGMYTGNDRLGKLVATKIAVDGILNIAEGLKDSVRGEIARLMEERGERSFNCDNFRVSYNSTEKTTYRPLDILRVIGNRPEILIKVLSTQKGEIDKLIASGEISEKDAEFIKKKAFKKVSAPVLRVYNKNKAQKKTPAPKKKEEPKQEEETDSTQFW